MSLVYQRFTNVSVQRSDGGITLRIDFMDSHREDNLSLLLDSTDFTVKKAHGETPRSTDTCVGERDMKGLQGKKIYLNSAQGIKTSFMGMPKEERDHFIQLLLAGVSNVVQAEAFLWKERGFSSPEEYEESFRKNYKDNCVYYANLDRVKNTFMTYVDASQRARGQGSLFNRNTLTTIRKSPGEEKYLVRSNLCDSFHEMAIKLLVDYDRSILATRLSILRVPDAVCAESLHSFQKLVGRRLATENIKKLVAAAGGPKGCSHLGDLVVEGAKALDQLK